MGIPGYYLHILRNYPGIVRISEYFKNIKNVEHFYMDANSVIYDYINEMEESLPQSVEGEEFENILIRSIIDKIDYLYKICWSNKVNIYSI
jgi:hypothetical protein